MSKAGIPDLPGLEQSTQSPQPGSKFSKRGELHRAPRHCHSAVIQQKFLRVQLRHHVEDEDDEYC